MGQLREAGFQRSAIDSSKTLDSTLHSTPFLDYSYRAWSHHARESLNDDISRSQVSNFIQECHAFPILPRKYGTFDLFGPLHVAAYFDLPLSLPCQSLLRDPNILSHEESLTPLHLASLRNSRGTAKELLGLSNTLVNAHSKHGDTALMLAAQYWAKDVFELLVSHTRTKIDQSTKDGWTALHSAARSGNTAAVKQLLANPKLKVNAAVTYGTTPLMLACEWGYADVVRVLVAHNQINVNLATKDGDTALIIAARSGREVDVVKTLLAQPQIDIDRRDRAGQPALYYAHRSRLKGRREIIEAIGKAYREAAGAGTLIEYSSDDPGGSFGLRWVKDIFLSSLFGE